jgi:thiamine-phosphate pyrophosphorylase
LDELRLCLVTDRTQTRGRDLTAVVGECLGAGLPAVQAREKDLSAADLAFLCRRLRTLTLDAGALLIVNDRVDVALAVGADAVQRTGASLPIEDIRAIADKRLRIGASVHALEEAVEAEVKGADWVVFGPIYDTPSKRSFGPPQGLASRAWSPPCGCPSSPSAASRPSACGRCGPPVPPAWPSSPGSWPPPRPPTPRGASSTRFDEDHRRRRRRDRLRDRL